MATLGARTTARSPRDRGRLAAFALCALVLFARPAAAQIERYYDAPKREPFIKVSAGPWFSSGMGRWQTSFPLCANFPKSDCGFGSTLEFQDRVDRVYLFSVEARPHPRFSFEFQYADSAQITGHGRDHDWLDGPNTIFFVNNGDIYSQPNQYDMSLSQNDLSGRTTYVSVNAFARLVKLTPREEFFVYEWVDLSAGFTWYDDRYRMKNLVQLLSNPDMAAFAGTAPPAPGNYANLDQTFHFHWYGPKIGVREETGIIKNLSVVGYVSGSPFMRYYGEGFWNLRTAFRKGSPSFTQAATASMIEGKLSVKYTPLPFISAEAGYMIEYFHTRPGTMVVYLANGGASSQDLDSAWSERKGFMLNLSLQY